MQHIEIQGNDIHSLIELRRNFDLKEVTRAFLDGTLVQWLNDCYYEREAATLEQIPREDLPIIEEKLCKVLGVDYMKCAQVTPEQLSAYSKKRECVLQSTDNTEILNRLDEVATTQVELAQLLNIGAKTIYLCGTSFSIPIRKIGVHYIGIGNPIVDSPFTEEQYQRAGVTFENVTLQSKGADEMQHIAEEAAAMNGYDDYGNDHSRLSTMVHNRLKISSRSVCCHLETDPDDVMMEFFKSKSKADKSAQDIINTAYDEANAFFTPGQGTCIASPLAVEYVTHIKENTLQIVKLLQQINPRNEAFLHLVEEFEKMLSTYSDCLHSQFEAELQKNADYYKMYKRNYFLERYSIEESDFNVDLFDSDILNGIARLLCDETEYTVEGLFEIVAELEDDVRTHADVFFSAAYQIYQKACEKLEKIAEEIGQDLSDDDFEKLGLQMFE